MKLSSTLIMLSVCAISACTEESPTSSAQPQAQQPIANNPLAVVPPGTVAPTTPATPAPQTPPAQVPVNDQPTGLPLPSVPSFPTLTPDGSGAAPSVPTTPVVNPVSPTPVSDPSNTGSGADLINGASANSAQTLWQCEGVGNTDPNDVFQIAFYSDNTAMIATSDSSALINWDSSSNGVFLTVSGSSDSISFDGISFVGATQFQADFTVSGVGSAPIVCDKLTTNGDPIAPSTQNPSSPAPAGQGTIINGVGSAGLENFWSCRLSSGDEALLFFGEDGSGALVDSEFPEGIDLSWTISTQGISITLVDGNQVILSSPVFNSATGFFVDSIVVNGSDVGGMSCELTQAT